MGVNGFLSIIIEINDEGSVVVDERSGQGGI